MKTYPISPYAVTVGITGGLWRPRDGLRRLHATLAALQHVDKLLATWSVEPMRLSRSSGDWSLDSWTSPSNADRPSLRLTEDRLVLELPQRTKALQRLADPEKLDAILHALIPIWQPTYAFVAPADWPTLRLMKNAKCWPYVGWITLVPENAIRMRALVPEMRVERFDRARCLVHAVEARYTKRNRAHNAAVEQLAAILDEAGIM